MPTLDRNLLHRYGLLFVILLVGLGLTLTTDTFLSVANLTNVARQVSINGILAVGVTFVLLTAGVDLSLGSVVALSGVACATFAHPGDHPVFVPIVVGLLTGAACGLVNGVLVTRGGVAPFIVTLGMMTISRGLALIVSGGRPVANMSNELTALAGDFLGIPIPVLCFAGVALAAWFFLRNFRLGRHIYAVGGNENAARAAGVPVERVKLFAYGLCGLLTGLAGVVLAARITTGQPNAGQAYELDAIAAVVIGGTSLAGGVGTITGTLLGVLLIGVINNGLDLLGVSSYYQAVIKGVIIVGAVWLDRRQARS
ncbi:MAG: ABC transporter permease [Opitutales bacterium]|jgi:ribose/xylose/arabinose/galactoside ABC-type transport system permease subunit|nr:ABC transporter permease [Opitutales bacterium]MDP4659334.1 ABC transporter permease [Opitutales bacterium]MDP4774776.1 ABC transporter permease [Opitutales bacterium]MDP4787255.1 ABC transporter permease [Opitutales bacterium]MDP4860810.1 ABC transporter permease [Opitutales bacterium]